MYRSKGCRETCVLVCGSPIGSSVAVGVLIFREWFGNRRMREREELLLLRER